MRVSDIRVGLCVLALLFTACGERLAEQYGPNAPTDYNVVLVTFDGLRWQELFGGEDPLLSRDPHVLFPQFWEKIAPRGVMYGDPSTHGQMRVATAANASLPGYMSIYAETEQDCLTNYCPRIAVRTFVDRLHDELGLPQDQLAVFASWWKMRLVVSARDKVATVEAGVHPWGTGFGQLPRGEPDLAYDFDRGTVMDGPHYLSENQPRFLHLALLDSDRFGHQNNYQRYARVLQAYDRLLVELVQRLDDAGEYGRKTALIITTDHGRGLWDQWQDHGPQVPASADVWAFVMLPPAATGLALVPPDARAFDHHDVRYTIETLFGLSTRGSSGYSTGFVTSAHR